MADLPEPVLPASTLVDKDGAFGHLYTADQMRTYAAAAVATAARDVAVLSAEVERLETALRAAWEQVDAAVAAERERLRGHFLYALADTKVVWPGEVDILFDKCFVKP
jgi:predicted phage tail protein